MWVAPRRLLHTSALLLALASPREASQYCGRLEYWNPDNRCCRSCQQRFGPPPCPDYEFVENCGLNDFGDLLTHPFKKCSPGQCNPDGAELCSPCNSGVPVPTPPRIHGRTQQRFNLEALERQDLGKVPLLPLASTELAGLISQPLSRLLDELEVLEELIVLLDPEPGPGGGAAYGTSRHLAARYGLPAAWSTFAYSLRPSRSPLRALIEVVAAREPSASLGQFGAHLAELGRADALRVLSKLG
ncbi:IGF-like family receptor 1 [Ctenodactylus gundi]